MPLAEPGWWYGERRPWVESVLRPLSHVWSAAARRRYEHQQPYTSSRPVICVGNLTAGGTGKTPTALLIAELLTVVGRTPIFLSRGYGGTTTGPHWVTADCDPAAAVGDEPLLLARAAPTMVCRDRAAGARAIEGRGQATDVIVMDDGLQNGALAKSLSICVVDARRGIGNGLVMPAGPLRAPLDFQLGLVDAILVNGRGGDGGNTIDQLRHQFHGPVLQGSTAPTAPPEWLAGARVVAYCGIGAPARFFGLLRDLGADVAGERAFPDHHSFSDSDAAALLAEAERLNARLVTTAKDIARLSGAPGPRARLAASSTTLDIRLELAEADLERMVALIRGALVPGDRRSTAL